MSAIFPGYEYDKEKKCYFRVPPPQFRRMFGQPDQISVSDCRESTVKSWNGCSVYKMTQTRLIERNENAYSERRLKEHVLPTVETNTPFKGICDAEDKSYKHILIDKSGEMLATIFNTNGKTFCNIQKIKTDSKQHHHQQQLDLETGMHYSLDCATAERIHWCVILRSDKIVFIDFNRHISAPKPLCYHKSYRKPVTSVKLNSSINTWPQFYYAVGFVKGSAEVCDHFHQRIHLNNGTSSDTLSLGFSLQDPILFTGHRNGICLLWDLRCHPMPSMVLRESNKTSSLSSSVVRIHPLTNSHSIVLNTLYANLHMWDIRAGKSVLEFEGHVSDYRTCTSFVDELQSFLVAVGTDGFIRYWSLQSGKLMCSFTPKAKSLPHITYTDSLGGKLGKPSLLVADENISIYQT